MKKKSYTLSLRPSFVKEVDEVAEKLRVSRSRMFECLGEMAIDDMDLLDEAGFIELVLCGRAMVKNFKNRIFRREITLDADGNLKIQRQKQEGTWRNRNDGKKDECSCNQE